MVLEYTPVLIRRRARNQPETRQNRRSFSHERSTAERAGDGLFDSRPSLVCLAVDRAETTVLLLSVGLDRNHTAVNLDGVSVVV